MLWPLEAIRLDQEQLLSKKELLDLTGISYGQLYRWKRKNLIPEAWFVRKSTFTGQETFFPKDKILARVAQIKQMKEDLSLDELAHMFSPSPDHIAVEAVELSERNIVTGRALELYLKLYPADHALTFKQVLSIYVTDLALKSGDVSLSETTLLMQVLNENGRSISAGADKLMLVRKLGVPLCVLTPSASELVLDDEARIVWQIELPACIEALKLKLV